MKNHGSVMDTNILTPLWNTSKNVMKASTTVSVSLFNTVTGCKHATLLKRDSGNDAETFIALSVTLQLYISSACYNWVSGQKVKHK